MNKILIFIILLLQINIYGQSKMMTTKSFMVENETTIEIPSDVKCNLKNYRGTRILIDCIINANCSEQILNSLFKAGAFSIIAYKSFNNVEFSMPNLKRVRFLNGKELNIDVNWNVLIPNKIKIIETI